MTRVIYELANGTTVYTMAQAKESGLSYKVSYETIEREPCKLTEKRKAMLVKANA